MLRKRCLITRDKHESSTKSGAAVNSYQIDVKKMDFAKVVLAMISFSF